MRNLYWVHAAAPLERAARVFDVYESDLPAPFLALSDDEQEARMHAVLQRAVKWLAGRESLDIRVELQNASDFPKVEGLNLQKVDDATYVGHFSEAMMSMLLNTNPKFVELFDRELRLVQYDTWDAVFVNLEPDEVQDFCSATGVPPLAPEPSHGDNGPEPSS